MADILDKIKKIEALILGATTVGEKIAAISAKQRILDKYPGIEINKQQKEWALRTQDNWHKKLLIALCRKYEIKPYRYARQKYTTVMVKINEEFLNKVLWPEYLEYSKHLEQLMEEIANDLINKIYQPENEEIIIQGELQQANR